MKQRKIHIDLLSAIRFYLRLPLLKRWCQLALKKERQINLEVAEKQSGLVREGQFILELTIVSRNVFVVHVNGLRIPVLRDDYPIKVTTSFGKQMRSVAIVARGIGNKKAIRVSTTDDRPVARTILLKRKLFPKTPALLVPILNPKRIPLDTGALVAPALRNRPPVIKQTSLILAQTLTAELLETLARNSKTHE